VNRVLNLCIKYCGGVIPDVVHDPAFSLPFDLLALVRGCHADMQTCAINSACFKAMEAARETNKYLTAAEPWKMKGPDEARRPSVVRTTLEAIYVFTHFLAPVIPVAADKIFKMLNTCPMIANKLNSDFYNLVPDTKVSLGAILFQKIENKK
jgi:methionyl-tRNA synthetase